MIRIERNNLEEIANEYYSQIVRIINNDVKGNTDCHKYYLANLKEFILCGINKFEDMANDFWEDCKDEVDLTTVARKEYKNYINDKKNKGKKNETWYKDEKERLKKAISNTPFMLFTQSMKKMYEDNFQEPIKFMKDGKLPKSSYSLGFWLSKELDVKTCLYCNRAYTFTVKANSTTRPEFDHFRPKSEFPFFALSFYNLIPSCPVCNHLKGEKRINIHPYEKDFGNDYKFRLDPLEIMLNNEVSHVNITPDDDNTNIGVFMLNELYNNHMDYINEIVDKAKAYNADYYDSLIDSFHQLGARTSEINRYIWGCYLEVAEHGNRPLSKVTKDILDQLDIVMLE